MLDSKRRAGLLLQGIGSTGIKEHPETAWNARVADEKCRRPGWGERRWSAPAAAACATGTSTPPAGWAASLPGKLGWGPAIAAAPPP